MLTVVALKNPGRVLSQKFYSGSVDLEEHLLARRTTVDSQLDYSPLFHDTENM